MKKLLSLVLVALMVLSLTSVGFAAEAIDGWNGSYSVTAYAERDAVVKVSASSATFDPARGFYGVVMLTADIYAANGGTITLEDASGNIAGKIELADGKINGTEVAYNTADWNTLSIFALTGTKRYQIFLGDTFVCEEAAAGAYYPSVAKFSSNGDMYVDNASISQMEKKEKYAADEITYSYNSGEFAHMTADAVASDPLYSFEGFIADQAYNGTGVSYDVIEHQDLGRVMEMKSTTGSGSRNELRRSIPKTYNTKIIAMDVYVPSKVDDGTGNMIDNNPTFQIYLREQAGWASNLLLRYHNGGFSYGVEHYVDYRPFTKDAWTTFQLELSYDSQSMDMYLGDTKLNPYPIPLCNESVYGNIPSLGMVCFQMYYNGGTPAVMYMKNMRYGEPATTVDKSTTAFSENFNADTAKMVYTVGNSSIQNNYEGWMPLSSNQTSGDGTTGVGKLKGKQFKGAASGYSYAVTENAPLTGTTAADLTTYADSDTIITSYCNEDGRWHNATPLDLSGADSVVVNFKYYCAAMARHRTSYDVPLDYLRITLTEDIKDASGSAATAVARPFLYIYRGSIQFFDAGTKVADFSPANTSARVWQDATLTIEPGKYTLKVGAKEASYTTTLTKEDIAKLKYINFGIEAHYGGTYYLDDIVVQKLSQETVNELKTIYSADESDTYEDAINTASEKETSFELTFTDGIYTVGAPKDGFKVKTIDLAGKELPDGSKLIAAVYNGGTLSSATFLDKEADGSYDVTANNMTVTADSKVKVFYFKDMTTIIPLDAPASVDKNIDRAKLYVIGDSTSAYYPNSKIETAIFGWGDFLGEYMNQNEIEVINYGKSGRSAKGFVTAQHSANATDDAFETLLGENGLVSAGDYVLLCLGINDGEYSNNYACSYPYEDENKAGSFRYYMNIIIEAIEAKGAHPILVAEAPRCVFKDTDADSVADTQVMDETAMYASAVKELALDKELPIVDAYGMFYAYKNSVGYENAFAQHVGGTDYTHYNLAGAKKCAELIVKGLKLTDSDITDYIK